MDIDKNQDVERDWNADMQKIELSKHAKTLCNNPIPRLMNFSGPHEEILEIAEYYMLAVKAKDETIKQVQVKLSDLKRKYRRLLTLYDESSARSCEYAGQLQEAREEIEELRMCRDDWFDIATGLDEREKKIIKGLRDISARSSNDISKYIADQLLKEMGAAEE